jgi:23S rRNA pseudouridine1911/1915/1917 synthase
MLSQGRVSVNGIPCAIASHPVLSGDILEIGPRKTPAKLPDGLMILYEDADILVIQKPAGLLTVATAHERERTAYAYLRRHLKERWPRQRLFIVHRLDKFASGILVFAKTGRVQSRLQNMFSRHDIQRKYWAVVEGTVKENHGTIKSRLAQGRSLRMHSTSDKRQGKPAVTHFRVLRRMRDLSTLEVTLETGRKNQIRAHLSEMGHPIMGDRAYGSKQDPLGRSALHAFRLGFTHPTRGTPCLFETEAPPEFLRYLPKHFSKD